MELTSVELPKKEVDDDGEDSTACMPGEENKWPYGLVLRFEKEQVEAIPELAEYEVGDVVKVVAEARVVSIRKEERKKEAYSTIEMQIEKVGCELLSEGEEEDEEESSEEVENPPEESESSEEKPPEKMSMKEYREMRNSAKGKKKGNAILSMVV